MYDRMCVGMTTETSFRFNIFFFNDTATPEIYPLSLHDALPFYGRIPPHKPPSELRAFGGDVNIVGPIGLRQGFAILSRDRKSTRLNSSHSQISYAVFCLKKKKQASL